jgi:CheY-like chemotaxis protein
MAETKKTILVCDDNGDILELVTLILDSAGYRTVAANGYQELFPLLEKTRPDLLLCDIRMPDRDGFWIAEQMQMRGMQLPIIFMTAYDSNLYRTYAPFVGAVGFVTKPVHAAELLQLIHKTLNEKKAVAASDGDVEQAS